MLVFSKWDQNVEELYKCPTEEKWWFKSVIPQEKRHRIMNGPREKHKIGKLNEKNKFNYSCRNKKVVDFL